MPVVVLGDSWVDDLFATTTWVKHVFPDSISLGKLLSCVSDIDSQRKITTSEKYIIHVGGDDFLTKLPFRLFDHFKDCIRLYLGLPSLYYAPIAKQVFEDYRRIVSEISLDSRVVVCSIPIGPAIPFSMRIMRLSAPFQCKKVTESIRQIIDSEFRKQFITLPDVILFDIYEVAQKNKIKYHFDGLHPTDEGHEVIANNYKEQSFVIKTDITPTFTKLEACIGTFFSVILGIVIVPSASLVVYTYKKVKHFL